MQLIFGVKTEYVVTMLDVLVQSDLYNNIAHKDINFVTPIQIMLWVHVIHYIHIHREHVQGIGDNGSLVMWWKVNRGTKGGLERA